MNQNQIEALADFMGALESALVNSGVRLADDLRVQISDGKGGLSRKVIISQDFEGEEPEDAAPWLLEATFL